MTTPRGYSFPLVVLLCCVLGAATAVAVVVLAASTKATQTAYGRRKAFYTCDGVSRTVTVAARPYLRTTTTPTTADLMTAVCGGPGPACPNAASYNDNPEYGVDTLTLAVAGATVVKPIANGPFRGMNAMQTPITTDVRMSSDITHFACSIQQKISLAEIGLFQFFIFADGYNDLFPGPDMDIDGRVHVNGELCAHPSNTKDLTITQLTASGRIVVNCTRQHTGTGTTFYVRDPGGTTHGITASCDSGCVNCGAGGGGCAGNSGDWRAYALARWGGNLQDVEHNVPALRLPIAGTAAVQDGLDASGAGVDNSTSLRLLIDPPRAGDTADVRAQRYAFRADIRIIDGVWYKNDGTWPGTPIWSDHPGTYTPPAGTPEDQTLRAGGGLPVPVGQADIGTLCTDHPRGYSYFVHDCAAAGGALLDPLGPESAVVSYGFLVRNSSTVWAPTATTSTKLDVLRAARKGFVDYRVLAGGAPASMLPMNFDVGAFGAALQNLGASELGTHFAGTPFNGVVYIENTWNGSHDNFGGAGVQAPPALWPDPTGGTDASLPAAVAPENRRLPWQLCSQTAGTKLEASYTAQSCASPALVSRVNAVRIINAEALDPVAFPDGLSIVTNGPVYLLGDTNAASVTTSGGPGWSPSATWVPFMVGGDAMSFLSKNWQDGNASWGTPASAGALSGRAASTTMYAVAAIAGNVETSMAKTGGGLHNFPRFLEDWSSQDCDIFGSLVVGFRSVYQRQPFELGAPFHTYDAPNRDWRFDASFNIPANQPPGAPSFFVQAIERWVRE